MRGKEEAKTEWISLCKRTYVCVRSSSSDELQANENENNNKLFLLPLPLYLHYLTNRQTDSRLVEKKKEKIRRKGKEREKKGKNWEMPVTQNNIEAGGSAAATIYC